MKKEDKTNVMRVLDSKKIEYKSYTYSDITSGPEIAEVLGQDPNRVFKTLVTESASRKNYVFVLPVNQELDLKKAAKSVGEKSISMLKSKELLPLTGYVHGGCSPIGMKKQFVTVFHHTATDFDKILFSAGRIGYQVELSIKDLEKVIRFTLDDVTAEQ